MLPSLPSLAAAGLSFSRPSHSFLVRASQVHMNHSRRRGNVRRYYDRSRRRIAFFTTRDVAIGEELLYE